MASNLESIPSKLLFKIFAPIAKEFKNSSDVSDVIFEYYEDKLRDKIYERGRVIGFRKNTSEDLDFVARLIELNFEKFQSDTLEGDLEIPESKEYSIIIKADQTQWTSEYWEHRIYSYSNKNAENSSRWLESNGELDYFNGQLVDTDYHDTETTEIRIDSIKPINESIRKVKSIVEKSDRNTLERLKKLIEERISKV
jgi:hypothetical protein